jgi:hypothetical protein
VTWWLQAIILLLGRTPFKGVFIRIYDLGARRVVAALSSHPAVCCILGSGSYFEKRPTYGLSDVDLIIVLNDKVTRADASAREIAHIYNRAQRVFQFLGRWAEKEANLIYLSDIAAGFSAPESFRIRYKQGKLVPLYGALPSDIVIGPITTGEVLSEIDTLLRFSLVADPGHAKRQIFWKRIFTKLIALADTIDLPEVASTTRERFDLNFLNEDDTRVFFRAADPAAMFALQLTLSRRMMDLIAEREPMQKIHQTPFPGHQQCQERNTVSSAPAFLSDLVEQKFIDIEGVSSVPIGFGPRMLYFGLSDPIPLLKLHEQAYEGILRLRKIIGRRPANDFNALVLTDGFLFVISRQPTFVDLVPLDPLQFANVYAMVLRDSLDFEMPASVLAEHQAAARTMFHALGNLYLANDNKIAKLPHPCIYREDEGEVIENALRILRAHAACGPDWALIQRSRDLFDYLQQKHPECVEFLNELDRYQHCLYGDLSLGKTEANNIYRCLHQFMYQVLTGQNRITVDPPRVHLGITVGVITRNRARDLAEMLESLTRQVRSPDEVLIVDNGSTDCTQEVLEQFRERLPIRCEFLPGANIPAARNIVVDRAANEIISFVDDDCITEPRWLAAVERGFLHAENIGMVGGWVHHQPAAHRSTVDNYYRIFHHTKS